MKPLSGRIYERKIKLCKWQLASEKDGITVPGPKTAGLTFALISHLKNCGGIPCFQLELSGHHNHYTSAFWQLADPHFLVAKLWLVWVREPGAAD